MTALQHTVTRAGIPAFGRERRAVTVSGIVQGVGFRPFVYALAQQHGLSGLVRNDAVGVYIEVEGSSQALDHFLRDIIASAPPLAVVEEVTSHPMQSRGTGAFCIEASLDGETRRALVSPDMATCPACLQEMFDPANRRYRYPFINCTHCGPRFTITYRVPYDRDATTMSGFPMCPTCFQEYNEPGDRRFHAQPNACPACGPHVSLTDRTGKTLYKEEEALQAAVSLLRDGSILALKGLGGFHLACDPYASDAVSLLRSRKVRQDKPFALMAANLEQIQELCYLAAEEQALLASAARPIVLLLRRDDCAIADQVAPRQPTLGIMLPYTPLHHILLRDMGTPLVMTSGNRSDEPIAFRDQDAYEQLGPIADCFVVHNRPIHIRCDDSIVRAERGQAYPLRRSRGYAPAPLRLAEPFAHHTLACGGELKSVFCLGRDRHAFLSHHIGDLENYETLQSFREGIEHFCNLFDVRPHLVAYDLHPTYLSTQYAFELEDAGMEAIGVQHHHAHIASCLADNCRPSTEQVIGVALDGTGYGLDGTLWGGEFLEGSLSSGFIRRAHLDYAPLPGGEAAIRQPWRAAIARLIALYGEESVLALPLGIVQRRDTRDLRLIGRLIREQLNTPLTSSAGRLFDTVAALLEVPGSQRTTYEGQAAIELELAATESTDRQYPFELSQSGVLWSFQTRDIITGVVQDILSGESVSAISAKFHRTMAEIVLVGCRHIRSCGGPAAVALSGGTFQNARLLNQAIDLLEKERFTVYVHHRVPANDGGLALGQAVLANNLFRSRHDEKERSLCV